MRTPAGVAICRRLRAAEDLLLRRASLKRDNQAADQRDCRRTLKKTALQSGAESDFASGAEAELSSPNGRRKSDPEPMETLASVYEGVDKGTSCPGRCRLRLGHRREGR